MTTIGGPAWKHKVDHFDYTLGSGLAFLKERTNADAGLLVIGRHQIATGGRVAASVLAALFVGVYVSWQPAPIVSPQADGADVQLLLSLQIAGAKINKARDALMRPAGQDPGQRLDQPLKIGN